MLIRISDYPVRETQSKTRSLPVVMSTKTCRTKANGEVIYPITYMVRLCLTRSHLTSFFSIPLLDKKTNSNKYIF